MKPIVAFSSILKVFTELLRNPSSKELQYSSLKVTNAVFLHHSETRCSWFDNTVQEKGRDLRDLFMWKLKDMFHKEINSYTKETTPVKHCKHAPQTNVFAMILLQPLPFFPLSSSFSSFLSWFLNCFCFDLSFWLPLSVTSSSCLSLSLSLCIV